ncbi:MAG: DUF3267 domain-containing protein [Planctomycetes bacterium]|nr:DUF3267 domain-containing protein [Planctomycetota bacterium]
MIIPGWLVSVITFPGVIVHEAAHMLFCKMRGIAVLDVCFFRLGNPAGYVIHEETEDFGAAFFVSVGPLIVNSILCLVFCFPAAIPVMEFDVADPISYFLIWLGVSIGMHAFPSTQDASCLWVEAKKALSRGNLLALIGFPLVIVIYIANLLSVFWFDYIYGLAIGLGLPAIFLKRVL